MSQQIKKYLGIVLLLIFSFPVVYQSWHVLTHHHNALVCTCEVHGETQIESGTFIHESRHNDAICPVCAYEFTVFVAPEKSESSVLFRVFHYLTVLFVSAVPELFSGFCKQLRAPPFILSF